MNFFRLIPIILILFASCTPKESQSDSTSSTPTPEHESEDLENPCSPTNPCAPANPCSPANPCAPSNPCAPANPCSPANPCAPSNPCAPANPCSPANPCAPSNPCSPANPCRPANPCAPSNPCSPANPCAPLPEPDDSESCLERCLEDHGMESVPYEMIEASCRADCGMPENLSPTDAILGSPTDDILGATNEPEVDYHRYFLSWEPCLNTLSNERGKEIVAALGDEQPLVLYRVHEDEVDAPHQIFLVQGRPLDGGGLARIGSITWPVSSEERTGEFLDSEDNQVATIERQGPTVVVQSEGSPPTTLVCGDLGTDSLTTFVPEGPAWIPLSGDIRLDFHYGYRRGEGEEWLRYLNEVSVTSLDGARQAELLLNYEGDIYLVSGKGGYEFHFPYEELNLEEANRVQAILTSKSGQRSRTLYIPYETYKTLVGGWLHPSIWGTLSSIDPEAVVNQ